MAFRIATNVSSLNTQRWLGVSNAGQAKSLERLSSGYKINKAADDAAGIAMATKLNVKIVSLAKSIDNGNQGLAMLQAAEGGMDTISNILTRLKEIATQSASANTVDRVALNQERQNLEDEITKIADNTQYGSTQLLKGATSIANAADYGASISAAYGIAAIDVSNLSISANTLVTFAYGDTAGVATLTIGATTQTISVVEPANVNTLTLNFNNLGVKITVNSGLTTISAANGFTVTAGTSTFDYFLGDTNNTYNKITASIKNFRVDSTDVIKGAVGQIGNGGVIDTAAAAQTYLAGIDNAVQNLTTERGKLGAAMNQISYHVANLESMNENTKASTSVVKDADFAAEMADFTKFQILNQSGISMLAQANQLGQQILSLLK